MKTLSAESQAIAAGVLSLPCAVRPLEQLRRLLFGRPLPTGAAEEAALCLEEGRRLLADIGAADRLAVAIADARALLAELEEEEETRDLKVA